CSHILPNLIIFVRYKITVSATEGLVQQAFGEIANFVVNSRLHFARNFILTERTRLRSSEPSARTL
ncbi:hypothetical protein ACFFVK_18435, partial [Flavobacterium gyeonganense]